jgi:hypothetical protein
MTVAGGQGVVVEDGGAPMVANGYPFNLAGQAELVPSDTLATIRTKIQNQMIALFNSTFSRSDGNTITFVWLTDTPPGLLGGLGL